MTVTTPGFRVLLIAALTYLRPLAEQDDSRAAKYPGVM